MGKGFQPELDFRTGQSLESESSELTAFFNLSEHGFGFNRTVASILQALLACK